VTGNLRKRMLEEEHQRELSRMAVTETVDDENESPSNVFVTYTETVTEGDKTVTRSASLSVPDTATTTVDESLRTLRECVQASIR
jgi:hypothetical protein